MIAPYEVTLLDDGRTLTFDVDYPACDPFAEPDAEGHRPSFPSTFGYEVLAPFTVRLEGAAGPGTVMWIHSTPTSVRTCRVFWDTAFPAEAATDFAAYAEFEEKVWGPDKADRRGPAPGAAPPRPHRGAAPPLRPLRRRLPAAARRAGLRALSALLSTRSAVDETQ